MEHLLDVTQARQTLGISRPTLYRLVQRGQIPVVKIGDRTLFRSVDLERFVEQNLRSTRASAR